MASKIITLLKSKLAWSNIAMIGLFAVVLWAGYEGHLRILEEFLDQDRYSFKIGELKLTPYDVGEMLFIVLLIFWVAALIAGLATKYIGKLTRVKMSNRVIITKILQILIYVTAFLTTLNFLGINLTALTVFSGAIGIGLGFGLQKIASNFISGLILVFEKSVNVGDMVELSDGTFGTIKHSSARYTLLETYDRQEVLIPNEDFITDRVKNWTFSNAVARIRMTIGVSYGTDLGLAKKLILDGVKSVDILATDPAPVCHLHEFGDSSVNFLVFIYVPDVRQHYFDAQSEAMFAIWRLFQEHDIEIPFPQRDLHVKNAKEIAQYMGYHDSGTKDEDTQDDDKR